MQKVELLSPARDLVVGKAAIDNGADAVYIGAPAFGARKAAANSLEDIGTLVGYAHRFYCRVFVTLSWDFNGLYWPGSFRWSKSGRSGKR